MIVFGPVPSRRLGRSLGINNIPPKTCSYACVYCQVGRTTCMETDRWSFHPAVEISSEVRGAVERAAEAGETIDYLCFVPDGEPTLDANLGKEIALLRPLGIEVAVISNGSLISRPDVRSDLMAADWVSLKVDTVRKDVWRRVNRPHRSLDLDEVLAGMRVFAEEYSGRLVTETMLVAGLNDEVEMIEELAEFLADLGPAVSYLSIPTRPPAVDGVQAPDEETLARAWHVLSRKLDSVELLTGYEGDAFVSSGRIDEDLLAITAVHPMRESAVRALLDRAGADWSVVRALLGGGELVETEHAGHRYFIRRPARSTDREVSE